MTDRQVWDVWAANLGGRRWIGEFDSFEDITTDNEDGIVEIERVLEKGYEAVDHEYALAQDRGGRRWVLCRWFWDGTVEGEPIPVDWERRVEEYFEGAERFYMTAVFSPWKLLACQSGRGRAIMSHTLRIMRGG